MSVRYKSKPRGILLTMISYNFPIISSNRQTSSQTKFTKVFFLGMLQSQMMKPTFLIKSYSPIYIVIYIVMQKIAYEKHSTTHTIEIEIQSSKQYKLQTTKY